MRKLLTASLPLLLLLFVTATFLNASPPKISSSSPPAPPPPPSPISPTTTADHSKFESLKKAFKSGPEVTEACLACHTEAGKQIHKTKHWTWEVPMKDGRTLGKRHVVNNFCIAVDGNEARCTSCHVGYGWKDKSFDFTSEKNVDCLVCHDRTGTYGKLPAGAGHPAYADTEFEKKPFPKIDLSYVARHVGQPDRHNCGKCHFEGGGGDAVKHGDLDNSLMNPDRRLDVHMAVGKDGRSMECIDCHKTKGHQVPGSRYAPQARDIHGSDHLVPDDFPTTCASCHGLKPHKKVVKLNDHVDRVACQTCHIPTMARVRPTKMWWDWSKAGRFKPDGTEMVKKDPKLNVPIYATKKGAFRWAKNVEPEYRWFNGEFNYITFDTKVDGSRVVPVNHPSGSASDSLSRIWPFKVHRGKQPWDPVTHRFVKPKLFGPKGSGAYWSEFDWGKAISTGMAYSGREYSGRYGFVQTEMYWPISHMVAPKEDALSCAECHSRDGRLASLGGFYLPGRDANPYVEFVGLAVICATLVGVAVHGTMRFVSHRNSKQEG